MGYLVVHVVVPRFFESFYLDMLASLKSLNAFFVRASGGDVMIF